MDRFSAPKMDMIWLDFYTYIILNKKILSAENVWVLLIGGEERRERRSRALKGDDVFFYILNKVIFQ